MPLPTVNIGVKIGESVGHALGTSISKAIASAVYENLSDHMLAREYSGYVCLEFCTQLVTVDPLHESASRLLDHQNIAKVIVGADLFPEIHAIGPHRLIRLHEKNRRRVLIMIPEKMNYDALYNGLRIPRLPDYLDLILRDSPA